MATTPKESLRGDVGTNSVIRSNLGAAFQVATIAALKAVTVANMVNGQQATVVCYATDGDGGGGEFYFSSGSAATANNGTIIAPTSGSGRWLRNNANTVYVEWFGAKGDGVTDDTAAIQAALDYITTNSKKLLFTKDIYIITATLTVGIALRWAISGHSGGFAGGGAVIKWTGAANGSMLICGGSRYFNIDHIRFDGNNIAGVGIQLRNSVSLSVLSNFRSHSLAIVNVTGSPGTCLLLGEGDATPGISGFSLYDFLAYDSVNGVVVNNGGGQDIRFIGGEIVGMTGSGILLTLGGMVNLYSIDMANNATHVTANSGYMLNFFGGYFENGALLSLGNHTPMTIGIYNIIKAQSAGTPAIITYAGGTIRINSVGNWFPYSIDLSASAGSNALTVFSSGDIFTTGAWVASDRTFVIDSPAAGTTRLGVGSTFKVDHLGGQTRLASISIPALTGATPSVITGIMFEVSQGGATNITDFLNGKDGQLIVLRFGDGNSTIIHNLAKIRLRNNINVTPVLDQTITLCLSSVWYEIARNF